MLEILLVDDDDSLRTHVGEALREEGHSVTTAQDGSEAMACLDEQVFNLVVSDVRLPKIDGFEILQRVRRAWPHTDVMLMTGYGSIRDAVTAMRKQAVDYVTKPFGMDELLQVIRRIDERHQLQTELTRTRRELAARRSGDLIIGRTPGIIRLKEQIETIAATDASVLVTGESGSGKELVARMLHDRSPRSAKPFVAVNCGALPSALLEAELFGHERGAFTGAVRRREGRFQAAEGGTLFLDEIGEMPLEAQVKLLRVLEGGTFELVGSSSTERADVRIICATNRDLRTRIAEGAFREDLFYRVRVIEVHLPPLRERRADLPLLVERFLREFTAPGATPPTLSPAAWTAFQDYPFPGNVRELKHAVQHATILARGGEIDVADLPAELVGHAPVEAGEGPRSLTKALADYEIQCIRRALRLAGGERKRAAELLGISRKVLWKRMRHHLFDGVDGGAEPSGGKSGGGKSGE